LYKTTNYSGLFIGVLVGNHHNSAHIGMHNRPRQFSLHT